MSPTHRGWRGPSRARARSGGPGLATTNLAYLIYIRALFDFDVGGASAGGVIAIVLANLVAIFLIRTVAKNLEN